MYTVTVPTQKLAEQIGAIDGVDLQVWDLRSTPPLHDIDMVVCTYPQTADDRAAMALPERIGVVQVLSAGYDHIVAAVPEGAKLANGKGIHTTATAEAALALMLASQRKLWDMAASQRAQTWAPITPPPAGLADQRVAIVGYGDIGKAIARRLVACEALPTGFARTARPGDGLVDEVLPLQQLHERVAEFDIVCLVMPLTEATRHVVDATMLAAMKEHALLVNVGRGGLVDTDALVAALQAGRIRAALDVTDPEPLPDGHPLWSAPETVIFPHMGGNSQAQFSRTIAFMREQLGRLGRGDELLNLIDL